MNDDISTKTVSCPNCQKEIEKMDNSLPYVPHNDDNLPLNTHTLGKFSPDHAFYDFVQMANSLLCDGHLIVCSSPIAGIVQAYSFVTNAQCLYMLGPGITALTAINVTNAWIYDISDKKLLQEPYKPRAQSNNASPDQDKPMI
jgi:hypothetical protein